ncbi:MAG: hypothetical protein ACYCQJ_06255 [Nitrososphaerales archaeon]
MNTAAHKFTFAFFASALAVILRVYPTILNQAPWGTDAWPLIKNANLLLADTPTSLATNPAFDPYNIRWPAVSIFGSIGSLIFNAPPVRVMPILIPFVAAIATLFLFVIAEKITGNSLAAFIASLIFTSGSFDSIFTASATKETFAYPLFMFGLLILFSRKINFTSIVVFGLTSLTLAMSHHALSLIFALIVVGTAAVEIIYSFTKENKIEPRYFAYPLIISSIIALYLLLYALPEFPIKIGLSDVLSVSSFLAITLGVALYYTIARNKIKGIFPIGLFVIGLLLLIASVETSILPFAPVIPADLASYALPYLMAGFLMIFGYRLAHNTSFDRTNFSFLAVWLSVPVALFAYGIFGTPNGLGFIYRLFTFIYAPVAIFASIALVYFLSNKSKLNARILVVSVIVFIIISLSAYQSYASVVQGQDLLGGQWGYHPTDISAAIFVKTNAVHNMNISGDSKIDYLFGQYYGVNVDTSRGLQILIEGLTNESNAPLITDQIMKQNGYNLALYGVALPKDWSTNLIAHSSLVYSNGNDQLWY